jgi:hypothetical protein
VAAAHIHPQDVRWRTHVVGGRRSAADPEEEEDGPSRLGATVAAAVNCWSLGAAVAI